MRERYVELPETETSMNVRLLHVGPRRWYVVPRRWYVIFATGGAEIPRKNKLSTHRMCNSTETCRKSQMKRTMFKKEIHCVNKVGKCLNFRGILHPSIGERQDRSCVHRQIRRSSSERYIQQPMVQRPLEQ